MTRNAKTGLPRPALQPTESEDVYVCSNCGVKTTVKNIFSTYKSGGFLCPVCREKQKVTIYIVTNGYLLCFGVLCINTLNVQSLGWIVLNILIMRLMLPVFLIPHELGHAAVAGLLGMRIFKMGLGVGPRLFKCTILKTELEVRLLPIFAYIIPSSQSEHWFRLRKAMVSLAGPLTNGMMLFAGFLLVPKGYQPDGFLQALSPYTAFMAGNALIVACNLYPRMVHIESGMSLNDGGSLLRARSLKQKDIQKQIEHHYLSEALCWRSRKKYDRSKEEYEHILARFPNSVTGKNEFGALLMSTGEFRRAWDIFHELLDEDCENKYTELLIKNNFAYVTAVMGLSDYLGEADAFSKHVHDNLSWEACAKGTRGVVLIERGDIDEGISLLNQAIKLDESREAVAVHTCHIGIGEARKGNINEARDCLNQINTTYPECSIRPLLEKEVKMSVTSSPGAGSMFSVRLPMKGQTIEQNHPYHRR